MEADFVIVGGGTAGCILARRLSDNPKANVILIEAGPDGRHLWLRIPAGYGRLFQMGHYHWRFATEAEPELNQRSVPWPRGRVLGGSGAVNGLVFLRGAVADYTRWAERCGADWSYEAVLPFFKMIETWHGPISPERGTFGPVQVREAAHLSVGAAAFMASCETLGFQRLTDINTGQIEGAAPAQINVGRGLRSSTASAYLAPVRSRPNLRIVTDATVTSVVLQGRQATGVAIRREDGSVDTITARRCVVACAGAIGSPHLLMVSGIGPGDTLRRLGIPVVAENGAVGRNLQDHFYLRFAFETVPAGTLNEILASRLRIAAMGLRYALTRGGPLSAAATEATLFARVTQDATEPETQFHFSNFRIDARRGYELPREPGFMISFNQCRPQSRGTVEPASASVLDAPRIRANYMTTDADRRAVIAGVRVALRLRRAAPLARLIRRACFPETEFCSDDAILDFARQTGTTVYHPGGTCRMGLDASSAVDPKLAVRGVRGLFMVDASVMPTLPSANLQAPIMMLAERWISLARQERLVD